MLRSYDSEEFAVDVRGLTDKLAVMLIDKNKRYGNSALDPVRIFSKADAVEQIYVRIDDKLSRVARGNANDGEDVVDDLLGYLILLKIARKLGLELQPGIIGKLVKGPGPIPVSASEWAGVVAKVDKGPKEPMDIIGNDPDSE